MGGKRRTLVDIRNLSVAKFGVDAFNFDGFNYIDMKTKGQLVCAFRHRFAVSPAVHLRGDGGCKKCANKKVGKMFADTQEDWIKKSKETHGECYGYEKSVYRGQKEKVIITCRTCGEDFEQNPTSHAQGCGCPKCGIEKSRAARFLTDDDVRAKLDACSHLHPVKYVYLSSSSQDGRLIVSLVCPSHGVFEQRLDHHINGHGCVRCCSSISRSELEWIAYLAVSYNSYTLQTQYKVASTNYSADAYCKELNRVFEYHGDFWHGNPNVFKESDMNPRTRTTFGELYAKTLQKHATYERLGYNVTAVWEHDWKLARTAVVNIQRSFRARHSE